MAYNVEVVSLNLTSSDPNTVNISWRIKNNDSVTLKVFSDVSIEGENVDNFSETLAPGDTYDYWHSYEGVPSGTIECCVDATGAEEGII